MKKMLFSLSLLFLTGISLIAQENYSDEHKEFSFTIPEYWQCIKHNNEKYNLVFGEKIDNFIQNIIINVDKFEGSIEEYAKISTESLKEHSPEIVFIKNEPFKNISNLNAWKLISENDSENFFQRQYYYIFKKEQTFYVCVASVLQETSEEIEEVFDKSMMTFKLLPKQELKDNLNDKPDDDSKIQNSDEEDLNIKTEPKSKSNTQNSKQNKLNENIEKKLTSQENN